VYTRAMGTHLTRPMTAAEWADRARRREEARVAWHASTHNRNNLGSERVSVQIPAAPQGALEALRAVFRDESAAIRDRVEAARGCVEFEGAQGEAFFFLVGVASSGDVSAAIRVLAGKAAAEYEQKRKPTAGTEPRASVLEGFGERLDAKKRQQS
jgi:hypothetical protein